MILLYSMKKFTIVHHLFLNDISKMRQKSYIESSS